MKTNRILANYLEQSGYSFPLGGHTDGPAPMDIEDQTVVEQLKNQAQKDGNLVLVMFFVLTLTVGVLLYKMIDNLRDNVTTSICVSMIVTLVGVMHRISQDRSRAIFAWKVLSVLKKEDRIKVAAAILKPFNEFRFNSKNTIDIPPAEV